MEENLEQQLHRFWDLETLGIQEQEPSIRESFQQQIQLTGGRYQVSLPWKPTHRPLPSNLELAKKRLNTLLKKLQGTLQFLKEYDNIIQDQLKRGIVERVPPQELHTTEKLHYLPHHAVIRTDKSTTKLRIVYDASAKLHNKPALNDCLYTGPDFGQSIFNILLRFRVHNIAMAADIEKAFLMVSVDPKDRDVLRFLWSPDVTQQPLQLSHTVSNELSLE